MNCKQGDVAIVVGGKYNRGKIVTCLRLLTQEEFKELAPGCDWPDSRPRWVVDKGITHVNSDGIVRAFNFCRDDTLRPLRDNPGQDETLTWKEVPNTNKEPT